jgi:adenylosuccinate synthase
MFDQKIRTIVIVGAQWGDEGKGKLVDVLAERADWVVRYQGGANAGHTVHVGDESTVLHQVPSGILHKGVRCAIGNGVVLDPESMFEEVDALVKNGVDVSGRLYLSDRAHLVMPYHKLVDKERAASKAIGTTGRGIGPAYEDKVARRGIRVLDLRQPARLKALVERGTEHANHILSGFGSAKRADAAFTHSELERIDPRLLTIAEDVGLAVYRAQKQGAAVLLEGAQDSLLDDDHGTYPFGTSSSSTAGGAAIGVGMGPRTIDAALGVVKASPTRVGGGPMPTELLDATGEELRRVGYEFGATTGRPRRCGWFDAVVVRYAVRVNGLTGLAVTKLDVLDEFEKIGLCTGYKIGGEVVTEFPGDLADLEGIEPIYEWFDGWKQSTSTARTLSALPAAARRYLDRLVELVECPAQYVSVGTRRDQIIGL